MPSVSETTKFNLTLGSLATLIAAVIGSTIWLDDRIDHSNDDLAQVVADHNQRIAQIEVDVGIIKTDRYSLPMASEDALREAIANPGHRVPDPRNPGEIIVVTGSYTTPVRPADG